MQPLGFIHAPTNLGLSRYADGRERQPAKLPQALVQNGLIESIGAIEVELLTRLPYPDDEQRVEKTLNAPAVREFTLTLADAITRARGEGFTPLVCGGDCSVVLGCGVALARTGRYALVFLDAHHAYDHPGNTEVLDVAGADLAIVTGKGTDLLTDIEGRHPYFRRQDVLLFGFRSGEDEERNCKTPASGSSRWRMGAPSAWSGWGGHSPILTKSSRNSTASGFTWMLTCWTRRSSRRWIARSRVASRWKS